MTEMTRFGVSIPEDLLIEFDEIVQRKNYGGRSEAIRDAMRLLISQSKWQDNQEGTYAALNIVYSHKPRLMQELVEAQHNSTAEVMSSVHVHLTQSHCFELLTIKGTRDDISRLADEISGIPGIEYSQLFTYAIPNGEASHSH